MIDLSGHIALITGSTQGVGASIAVSLAQAGAQVILHGLRECESAHATLNRCRSYQPESSLLICDLDQDLATINREMIAPVLTRYPNINGFISNAGIFIDTPFLKMEPAIFDRTFHVNVKAGYFLAQAFARHWIANNTAGSMLFTGSINGLLAEPDHTAYDASKGAVAAMVRSLCVALAPHRIRVNSIAPGLVRTPLTNQILDTDRASLDWMELHTPNGQVPSSDVCGPMAAFLMSDLATHIHGQTICIDGGMTAWQQPDLPSAYRSFWTEQP